MPKYSYSCSACGKEFEIYHSMFETIDRCIMCEAHDIARKPSLFTVSKPTNAGSVVKEFIEDAKRDVLAEKQKLKEEYND